MRCVLENGGVSDRFARVGEKARTLPSKVWGETSKKSKKQSRSSQHRSSGETSAIERVATGGSDRRFATLPPRTRPMTQPRRVGRWKGPAAAAGCARAARAIRSRFQCGHGRRRRAGACACGSRRATARASTERWHQRLSPRLFGRAVHVTANRSVTRFDGRRARVGMVREAGGTRT